MAIWNLNPISHMGHSTLFYLIQPHFSNSIIKIHTFEVWYDLDIKNQDVNFFDYNIMTSLNLNSIVIGVTYPYFTLIDSISLNQVIKIFNFEPWYSLPIKKK